MPWVFSIRFWMSRTCGWWVWRRPGAGSTRNEHAASIERGRPGVLHGNRTYLLQDGMTARSRRRTRISAGLDYPGIGPEHAWLHDIGRAEYVGITDDEALEAFQLCTRVEGIIPGAGMRPRAGAYREAGANAGQGSDHSYELERAGGQRHSDGCGSPGCAAVKILSQARGGASCPPQKPRHLFGTMIAGGFGGGGSPHPTFGVVL